MLKHHKFSKCFAFHVVTVRFKISLWTYTDLIMSLKHLHSTKHFLWRKIMMKKRTQGPVCSEMPSESEEGRRSLSSLKLSVTLSHVSGLISLMFCFCTFYLYSWSSINHRVALLIGKITSRGVSIWRTWIQSMITSKLMSHAVTQRHGHAGTAWEHIRGNERELL